MPEDMPSGPSFFSLTVFLFTCSPATSPCGEPQMRPMTTPQRRAYGRQPGDKPPEFSFRVQADFAAAIMERPHGCTDDIVADFGD